MVVKTELSNDRVINFYMKKGFVQVGDNVETIENLRVELAVLKLALWLTSPKTRSSCTGGVRRVWSQWTAFGLQSVDS